MDYLATDSRPVLTYGNSAGRTNHGWRNNDSDHLDDSGAEFVKLADGETMARCPTGRRGT